ncbi:MAG TPA: DUF6152 family protein [Steroidobacteraceae bacterium]|nr:DUF6152 family protein [Steroidobacteraceae bacterium]
MLKHVSVLAGLVATTLTLSSTVQAHHSFAAEFDSQKLVHLEGTVVQFSWVNPHSWIYMDVKKQDGSLDHWKIEGGAPSLLLRRGWTKTSVTPGAKIIVNGFQARDGALRASARDIAFPDGRKLDAASSYKQTEQ